MCIVLLYARYIATTGINVNEYKITDTKIPKNMHGLKIVHISDIHYGRITFEKELKKVVTRSCNFSGWFNWQRYQTNKRIDQSINHSIKKY